MLTAKRTPSPPGLPGVTVHQVRDPYGDSRHAFTDYDPRLRPARWKSILREFVFPDRFIRWQRAAYRIAVDMASARRFDVIFASFPPASVVQLAQRLHRETRIPLVLDFRDRWLGPGGHEPRRRKTLKAHQKLEREAVADATAMITVSDAMADAMADEQNFDRNKILVLPNGYDPDISPGAHGSGQNSGLSDRRTITIAHVGTVIPRNRPDLFFKSMIALKDDPRLQNVVFKFVGNLSPGYLKDAGLAPLITTTGLVPREQARLEMRSADALLLLTGAYVGRWGHNAKLFEYLQSARPILCLEETPGSNDCRLLERFAPNHAFFARVDDAGAVADRIDQIKACLTARAGRAFAVNEAFRTYSRANLTARLADYLPT